MITASTRTNGSAADKNMKYGLYAGVFFPATRCSMQVPARKSTFVQDIRSVSIFAYSSARASETVQGAGVWKGTGDEKLVDVRMLINAFFSWSSESLSESSDT